MHFPSSCFLGKNPSEFELRKKQNKNKLELSENWMTKTSIAIRSSDHSIKIMAAYSAANPNHFVKSFSGVQIPRLIYGTAWKKERTADLVYEAVKCGYKGIDTACQPKHYNEKGVGEALKRLASEGITRQSLYIQTKFTSVDGQDPNNIPYNRNASLTTQVQQSLAASLKNIGTDYIDCLVLHSPMRTHDETIQVWRTFESFVQDDVTGHRRVKQLGLSNCYSLSTFQKLYDAATIKPAVLQNRFIADTGYDKGLRDFCKQRGIYYQSFWTLTGNPMILGNSSVKHIAKERGNTPEQIFFAYLLSTGCITPLTGTSSKLHMEQDLAALDIKLTPEEKEVFDTLLD